MSKKCLLQNSEKIFDPFTTVVYYCADCYAHHYTCSIEETFRYFLKILKSLRDVSCVLVLNNELWTNDSWYIVIATTLMQSEQYWINVSWVSNTRIVLKLILCCKDLTRLIYGHPQPLWEYAMLSCVKFSQKTNIN